MLEAKRRRERERTSASLCLPARSLDDFYGSIVFYSFSLGSFSEDDDASAHKSDGSTKLVNQVSSLVFLSFRASQQTSTFHFTVVTQAAASAAAGGRSTSDQLFSVCHPSCGNVGLNHRPHRPAVMNRLRVVVSKQASGCAGKKKKKKRRRSIGRHRSSRAERETGRKMDRSVRVYTKVSRKEKKVEKRVIGHFCLLVRMK